MLNFIYLAVNNNKILEETYFSILTLLYFKDSSKDFGIIIYTDKPEFFENLRDAHVQIKYLSEQDQKAHSGKYNFFFRTKLSILNNYINMQNENFIFIDSDTYFISTPDEMIKNVSPDNSIMYCSEGIIDGNNQPHYFKIFCKAGIKNKIYMWNSGVIGLDSHNFILIRKALELTDLLLNFKNKHTVEQISVSVLLQINTTMKQSTKTLFHYCGKHDEIYFEIKAFLDSTNKAVSKLNFKNAYLLKPQFKKESSKQGKLSLVEGFFIRQLNSVKKRLKIKYIAKPELELISQYFVPLPKAASQENRRTGLEN